MEALKVTLSHEEFHINFWQAKNTNIICMVHMEIAETIELEALRDLQSSMTVLYINFWQGKNRKENFDVVLSVQIDAVFSFTKHFVYLRWDCFYWHGMLYLCMCVNSICLIPFFMPLQEKPVCYNSFVHGVA